ncbi:hypothetical protein HMPREF3103_08530 [Granulicatella sp. HMSC30F09]|jgi:hypothetical protein|uniref:hypothetical protein n=1 Tax=unclassified Granulicatella TaxID=2630493 RepID=UPI00066BEC56|nr:MULTISPECIES: hypothetical protein [unclassified Granulicatella]OFS99314.1 hypothetical protein HMPREF3106_08160 [Granulicatella sp. HMSC31F03]OFT78455.1 hypothetical protein HMPREF3103_08530 [Granulicatella sp. HMSC30F09]
MKAFLAKLQEGFKSLGFASQLGIALGLSLAMLAGVYALSQDLSPLPKVTQVVEMQTTDATSSHSPNHSEKAEKKEVAQKRSEESSTTLTVEAPTTEAVTTEEKKVAPEIPNQETKAVVAASQEMPTTEKSFPQTKESAAVTSTEPTTVQRDVVTSTSTVATTETTEVTTAAYRLIPLGNSNKDFETYQEAIQYMRDKLDESSKAFEEGKQDWVYSGRVYGVPWSDSRTTFTVDLIPKVMTPQTPDTSGISTEPTQ